MNRNDLIKFIPKPSNNDVILYDTTLKDLIDVNVLEEYNKLYPVFINKRQEYIDYKKKLEEYQKTINNVYLFKPSWSEVDYLESLKNSKKTYATLYGEVKKIESNIAMLQKNLKGINEKIQIQIAKENKKINDRKENIDKDIEKGKEKLINLKNYLQSYNLSLNEVKDKIKENQDEFDMLSSMEKKLKEGKCRCEYCGKMVKSVDEDSLFYKRLANNFEKNKAKLEKLLKEQEKVELNIAFYENELRQVKDNLNNNIQFKKENGNMYVKKNIEVLKLEAIRDDMLNNIQKLEKQLASNSTTKTKQFLDLKGNIEKYELSLNNIRKIREIKDNMKTEVENFTILKEEVKKMLATIENYLKFINIYYKILEQKASQYCGNNFRFKLFKIEDYKVIPILEIFYKDKKYESLEFEEKQAIDKILIEKFSIYF